MTHNSWNFHSFVVPLLWAQAEQGQPKLLFDAVTSAYHDHFGFRFLTILKKLDDGRHIQRLHSSDADYPIGALKSMGRTPWGTIVLDRGKSRLGNSAEDIHWAFPDAELILSKGCDACACVPILRNGATLGVLSLTAERDMYAESDLAEMQVIAQTLAPALAMACPPRAEKDSTSRNEVPL